MKKSFSIIIPVLNESLNIKILTKKIFYFFTKHNYEIIFVDDNSTDNSKYIFVELKKNTKILDFTLEKEK